jgi:hypothetical protein
MRMDASARSKLQGMINRTVSAANRFHAEQEALNEWCREHYGVEPGDVDADEIIDGVLGANGQSSGMKASDFDAIMRARR